LLTLREEDLRYRSTALPVLLLVGLDHCLDKLVSAGLTQYLHRGTNWAPWGRRRADHCKNTILERPFRSDQEVICLEEALHFN